MSDPGKRANFSSLAARRGTLCLKSTHLKNHPYIQQPIPVTGSFRLAPLFGIQLFPCSEAPEKEIRPQAWCEEHCTFDRSLQSTYGNHDPHDHANTCQDLLTVNKFFHTQKLTLGSSLTHTHESILKKRDSISSPRTMVRRLKTPRSTDISTLLGPSTQKTYQSGR